MNNNDINFDRAVKETLNESVKYLDAPDSLKTRVQFAVRNDARPRARGHNWGKKLVAALAVAAVAATGAVAASGIVASVSSHTYRDKGWKSFSDTEAYVEQYVPDMKYLESFSNGYEFDSGCTNTASKNDENGVSLGIFTDISLVYEKDGKEFFFEAGPVQDDLTYASDFDTVRNVDGIEMRYRELFGIYLPPDGSIKPTPEEQARYEAGEINIAYGSEEREEQTYYSVKWIEDGIVYSIATFDPGDLTEDDFFDMAQEVVNSDSDNVTIVAKAESAN